jgi:ATP-binding cassette, subfamily F, member 3
MISIENLSKSFGGQVLFEDASFRLNSRERVGLVGRNGHGKSTLFRILAGRESADSGRIVIPKQYRIGHLEQHIEFTERTVLAEGMKGLPEAESDHHWKVEKVLAGLGFSDEDMGRPPREFSGGYQVRLSLAKVLVSEPDLLLLDEPTNYLDITSIRWIERFLNAWPRELLLITHDRSFMDRVVTHVVGIHRHGMRKVAGDTGKFYEQLAMEEEVYEKTRLNDERKRKEIEQFITRFRAKARLANLVQSRVKTLAKMEKKEKLETLKDLDFSFRDRPFSGRQMLSVRDLSFAYPGGERLFEGLAFAVGPGDRIGVVGKNGRGKTTLLKVLSGALDATEGEARYNPNVAVGIYEQSHLKTLVDSRTVAEEILYSDAGVDQQLARNIAGAMMFEGDAALKKVGVLSGGERSRVMLGKLLASPLNLLLLDEPTNHLDMTSCDALLEALDHFDGAVILVTHNEMFLHALVQRLVVFDENGASVFEGSYADFLERGGWGDEEGGGPSRTRRRAEPEAAAPPPSSVDRKALRKKRSMIVAERSRTLKPLEQKIARIEAGIEKDEKTLARLNEAMQAASESGDAARIVALSRELHDCQARIDADFERLETLTETLERDGAVFDEKLARLDAEAGN